ncbi:hypothetical protein CAPTEDRAFT_189215 [Capitella teleta]|uniref:Uncharacterized protein n=1 Tax=Capitella teleta TaxID=283909 RepID=R7T7Y9_CAPTE|nr:hypothetical protein CAPTEDRAFT_189215 [Capitella teleta]|eukprot:ELT87109.1 hypothetical protein CAPTEDRAFT_189215 [Capitella teleta]
MWCGDVKEAELLFGRRLNSRLSPLRTPSSLTTDQKNELCAKRAAHLKTPRPEQPLVPDQPVWVQDPSSNKWFPGVAQQHDDAPQSWWVRDTCNGGVLRRNIHDTRPRHSQPDAYPESTPTDDSERTTQEDAPEIVHEPPISEPRGMKTRSGLVLGQTK